MTASRPGVPHARATSPDGDGGRPDDRPDDRADDRTGARPEDQAVEQPTLVPIERLLRDLKTTSAGLMPREAARRLAIHGPNALPEHRRSHLARDIAKQLTHPLALLLWLAAGLALLSGTPTLTWAIVAVIAINAVVALLQEHQAERAVAALSGYLPARAHVRRAGQVVVVPATDVVPGDVLVINEGDQVSADARLISGEATLDMSSLTGESAPVERSAASVDGATRLLDVTDAVFSGTECTGGHCEAVVFATGAGSELGRIAVLAQHGGVEESPLERQVRRAAWLIAGVAILIGLLFLPLGLLAGLPLEDAAVFAVGLLVANVPEGLLPTITLALAVGVRALAKSGALVKRLSAVETLGSTSVICTDKTGTLTQNRMTVARLWHPGLPDGVPIESLTAGSVPTRLLEVMADCTGSEIADDPMEAALVAAATALGGHRVPVRTRFDFDSIRKRMSVLVAAEKGPVVLCKGAPETVLTQCVSWATPDGDLALDDAMRATVLAVVDRMAEAGLRVLALASRRAARPPRDEDEAEAGLRLDGLVALLDPPRPEVPAAVAACHDAGMRVHMITGDLGRTAAEIARMVGIVPRAVLDGEQVDRMSDDRLDHLLAAPGELVFARSTPEGKLRIAVALRSHGETVAMTGDGVNDAPALHNADIGVAMGRSGTDVARESATMVLTDDNFATIVAAVREGRRAYENMRKFVLYIFAHAIPEIVPFAVFALSAGLVPLPLTVLQILAIDLGTETVPALALGRERAEPDIMARPPRKRSEHLINKRLLLRAWLVMGSVSAVLTLTLFFVVLLAGGWRPGDAVASGDPLHHLWQQATTTTFATIVACQVGTAFAARTERSSLRSIGVFSNRLLLVGIACELLFAAALLYLPLLQSAFGTAAPPWWVILLLVPCPVIVWSVDEAFRAHQRRRAAARPGAR